MKVAVAYKKMGGGYATRVYNFADTGHFKAWHRKWAAKMRVDTCPLLDGSTMAVLREITTNN